MAVLNCGFETGVNAATIASTDQGDGDAWDTVTVGSGGSAIYDTTHVMLGAQAAKVASTTAAQTFVRWDTKLGTVTDHYWRLYLYMTANPGTLYALVTANSSTNVSCGVAVQTDGKLRALDQASGNIGATTNAVTANQWVRIEGHFIHSATVGQVEIKLFNTASSGTATETLTTAANKNTRASADRIKFGIGTAAANIGPIWLDQIQAGATSYPGVAPTPVFCPRLLTGVG